MTTRFPRLLLKLLHLTWGRWGSWEVFPAIRFKKMPIKKFTALLGICFFSVKLNKTPLPNPPGHPDHSLWIAWAKSIEKSWISIGSVCFLKVSEIIYAYHESPRIRISQNSLFVFNVSWFIMLLWFWVPSKLQTTKFWRNSCQNAAKLGVWRVITLGGYQTANGDHNKEKRCDYAWWRKTISILRDIDFRWNSISLNSLWKFRVYIELNQCCICASISNSLFSCHGSFLKSSALPTKFRQFCVCSPRQVLMLQNSVAPQATKELSMVNLVSGEQRNLSMVLPFCLILPLVYLPPSNSHKRRFIRIPY